jgi:hypothetical protein
MTRTERLAKQEANAIKRLAEARATKKKRRAERRAAEQHELKKRRYIVGQLVETANLFALSNADLERLFALLTPLADVPDPVAVLEALLCDAPRPALVSVDGYADLRSCGPYGASGTTVH